MVASASNFAWENPSTNVTARFAYDYSFEDLAVLFAAWGFSPAQAARTFTGLHRRGISDYRSLAGTVPNQLIDKLEQESLPIDPVSSLETRPSADGATKFLFHLVRGGTVEGVLMPFGKRFTLCISSQVGCALGCTFCATGTMGFRRHLSSGEMVAQVLHMRRLSGGFNGKAARLNVVFMGMGEPLHNLTNVMATFEILTHRHGMVLPDRDVAVSTSGLVSKIQEISSFNRRPQLMVSIAATTDYRRSQLMPVNRRWPLESLLTCLESYPLRKRERIMLSYVVIAGVNDDAENASRLAAMSKRFPSLINLIPMNPHETAPGMTEPGEVRLQGFYETLMDHGAFVTIRRSRGRDVAGACGQLVQSLNPYQLEP